MSPFQLVFEPSKCPSASTETSVRSKKTRSVKEEETEEFEKEGSREDGEKAPAAKRRKVPKSQSNVLLLHEDKLPLWLSYIDKPIKQQALQKHNRSDFYAFVDLATEVSAILPLWRLKLSVYFHLGEYY